MWDGATQIYIHVLVAITLALSAISPSCHFISSETSIIEICKADGSFEKVEVPAEFDPFADESPPLHSPEVQKQCAFCFAQTHIDQSITPPQNISAIQTESHFKLTTTYHVHNTHTELPQSPRAPPSFS